MGIPGFTAEISLYATRATYRRPARSADLWAGAVGFEHHTLIPARDLVTIGPRWSYFIRCGGLGEDCCRPPFATDPAFGPIVRCNDGLGCDVATGTCVAPCGGPGQPCCDGPGTRAVKWTDDGRLYSPNSIFMQEMCNAGACDIQSHRCFTCGMQDGGPCCPPDAAQATARCVGDRLECQFDPWGHYTSGTCRACGIQGRPPCDWGCDPPLKLRNGLCERCGDDLQLPCDDGCKPGLGLRQGYCRQCGDAGELPCDNGCRGGLKLRNGLCSRCGAAGQASCDAGCNAGTVAINGVCTLCGYNGQPPCANGCVYPYQVVAGVCRQCGASGQIPCANGCNQGLVVRNGLCATPQAPPQPNCAQIGGGCVPNTQPGTHCCQNPGAPALCVYGQCRACIPHGEVVPPFGTQICCSYGDQIVLDPFTGNAVCDIPDGPDG